MSWQPALEAICSGRDNCDPVDLVIRPKEHELGGFSVYRALPATERQMVGPFIFFDQMGPATLAEDQPVNVRPHPHIGLSTLTWLIEGTIMHRDSLGFAQEIHPGEVNWMTAGSGIVHSERTPERLLGQKNKLFGLQVWMAMPKDHEEDAPSFQHYKAEDIPHIDGDGFRATVVAGKAWGKRSPVAVCTETLYVDLRLSDGTEMSLKPEHEERAIYLLTGTLEVAGQPFEQGEMLVLNPDMDVPIKAHGDAHVILIGGAKMDGPRFKFWNFVSSSRERIDQAKADWKNGNFAKVPGDEEEFIPLP